MSDRKPMPTHRLHLALKVKDLARSIEFYRVLLDAEPDKVKRGYARFDLDAPPDVLTLNEGSKVRAGNRLDHLGVRVDAHEKLDAARERLKHLGCWIKEQPDVVCCHSRQSKFWVKDPDGVHWEVYVLVDDMLDAPEQRPTAQPAAVSDHDDPTCC